MPIKFLNDVAVDSSVLYVDTINNRVGIGTASPSELLHIEGTSPEVLIKGTGIYDPSVITMSNGSGDSSFITNYNNPGVKGLWLRYDNGSTGDATIKVGQNELLFDVNNGTAMYINSSRNVGINATSLYSKLHIGNSSNGNNNLLTMESSGPVWAHLKTPSNTQSQIGFGESQYVNQNTRGRIVYNSSTTTANNYMSFTTNFAEVMRITNSNVGIGTTSPTSKLTVAGEIDVTGGDGYRINGKPWAEFSTNLLTLGDFDGEGYATRIMDSDSSEAIRIIDSGKVGIGTASPATKLEINGPNHDANFTSGCLMIQQLPQGDRMFIDGNDIDCADGILFLNDYSLNAVRLGGDLQVPNGDVGIGTTSPAANLDVDGSFKLSDFTSTSVATTGSLSPNQNYQAPTQDTLADLAVDPSGNVVRGMQEGTWTFTKAQLDGTLGMTLISAPGVNKAVIVYESSWMIKYNATGAISANQRYEIRQASNTGIGPISQLPGAKINEILSNGQTMPGGGASAYGFYSRDVPADAGGRTFKTNTATTLHKNVSNQLPTGVETVSIKLRYRIYDATTF